MKRWLGVPALLVWAVSGCSGSAHAPATATPTPRVPTLPTAQPSAEPTFNPSTTASPTWTPVPTPATQYSQEQIAAGRYQLTNNFTQEFVDVSSGGVHTVCPRGSRTGCTDYVLIAVTQYAGNTQVDVSQKQFTLRTAAGARYSPATGQVAARAAQPGSLLPKTVLQPDDDTDFATGTVVFPVPAGPGQFNLLWRGHHVATLTKTARGSLHATR